MRFHAVAKGHKPGIYTSWSEAEKQIKGFKGKMNQSFDTREEAEAYMKNPTLAKASKPSKNLKKTLPIRNTALHQV